MSNELKTTFADLDKDAFKVYAYDLVEAGCEGPPRQRLQAYMLQTIARDRAVQAEQQLSLSQTRMRSRQHQDVLEELVLQHMHDYGRSQDLFTEVNKTDQEILNYLTADNAEVFVKDRTITGDAVLSGDGVKFSGLNILGTALDGDLTPSVIVNGRLIISGTDVTVDGIHFKFEAKWVGGDELPMVSFTGGTNTKLTFKNCVFENLGSDADARFFYGANSGGGTQEFDGCLIKNFTSWLLLDATTASGTATVKLDSFKMDSCKIENCMGSMAVRGKVDDPNGSLTFTNNLVAFGANGQHASFWDVIETNNTLRVVCTGNTVTGATKTDNRGFLQAWSRSAIPWMVRYEQNTIANFAACFRCACNATFYAPNTYDVQHSLTSLTTETTNVDNGGSYVYPYNDAAQVYAPENGTTFSEPAGDFAGLSNFAHA